MPRNKSGIERQVLWHKYSESANQFRDEGGERHFFTFVIINTPDKIPPIRQKINDAVKPILLEKDIKKGNVGDSGLDYDLFRLTTYSDHYLNFSQIYRGKVKWDRRLQPRKTEDGWDDLVKKTQSRRNLVSFLYYSRLGFP